ncbi:cytochrome P450 [Nonomuraea cavernae]|uniref:Cytochrome P450 n=1 Tax=Nonomuraea cavernae TaxID=2045107 RepID=A0A918DHI1_9ACTN|nr:cytochrome P450 [Nonomuraea cavernae]MCA2186864.1 cytochrome P450 [Nonomuraea cavernae]GGO67359.1 cytochrome P450 [Nonomuraea cavernae]
MNDIPIVPFARSDPLSVPAAYRELREREGIAKVRTPMGDEVWLVSGYEDTRALFADGRLNRSHPEPGSAARVSASALIGGPQGDAATEKPEHDRMRRLFVPSFSARRMKALREHVGTLVDERLAHLAKLTPPADLHAELSFPLPVLVICELLGVPFEDRDYFSGVSARMGDATDEALGLAAREEMGAYMADLIERKRHTPGEDVLSDLAGELDDDGKIAQLAGGLLFAGHETTVNRIDYGVLLLEMNPGQRALLSADPGLAAAAVEEILRLAAPSLHGLPRYAHDDIELSGVTIRKGEAVLLMTGAANRDERVFAEPDAFDLRRPLSDPHLSFGWGPRFCIGASLARVELEAVFGRLYQRFPDLRVAVPVSELRRSEGRITEGFAELPVTWSAAPR